MRASANRIRLCPSHVHVLLILDGAALVISDNLTLLHSPAYSPELNPAEQLWRKLRQRHLSNAYADIDALDNTAATACLTLTRDTSQLRQLTHFPWIQSAQAQANICPVTF